MVYNKTLGTLLAIGIVVGGIVFWSKNTTQRIGLPCRDPLASWRSGYVVREDYVPYGTYRVLYKDRRLAVFRNGKVCDCDFKSDPPQPLVARYGHLEDGHVLKWDKVWGAANSTPPAGPESLATVWKDDEQIKALLIETRQGCQTAIVLSKDAGLGEQAICGCFGLPARKKAAAKQPVDPKQGFSEF